MRLKRTFSLSILPLALLAGCCSDHEALEKQNAAILAEMKKINARLERLEKQSRQNRMNTQTFVSRSVPADRSKLSQIRKLPEKPTDAQIVEYIRQIGEATAGQTLFSPRDPQVVLFSPRDPQVALFEEIGPGHLPLLLPYLRGRNHRYMGHLQFALPKLIGEDDKELVRRSLKRYPELLRSVIRKGWQKEMSREILSLLELPQYRPSMHEISDCLPDLIRSPEDLKLLTDVYLHDLNGHILLEGLKKVPGADIRKLVNQAWAKASRTPAGTTEMTMSIFSAMNVIRDGGPNVEAVKFLLKQLSASSGGRQIYPVYRIAPFLTPLCDFPIHGPDRLAEWYEKNADRIVFDPAKGKYVLKK
ncbi:MAG: hypothetical protein IJS01_12205 [Lentisphaeria bacterium]|nr:hypothetical protein [Lentisphaeria bacterium]